EPLRHRVAHFMGRQAATEVARAFAGADGRFDRTLDRVSHFVVTQVSNHHRCAQNGPDRIDDATTCDVGRGAVDRLEQPPFRLRVDVSRRRYADTPDELRGQFGQDVVVEVAGDDVLELRRIGCEPHTGVVDIYLTRLHLLVFAL